MNLRSGFNVLHQQLLQPLQDFLHPRFGSWSRVPFRLDCARKRLLTWYKRDETSPDIMLEEISGPDASVIFHGRRDPCSETSRYGREGDMFITSGYICRKGSIISEEVCSVHFGSDK